jgi:hypothetical protein
MRSDKRNSTVVVTSSVKDRETSCGRFDFEDEAGARVGRGKLMHDQGYTDVSEHTMVMAHKLCRPLSGTFCSAKKATLKYSSYRNTKASLDEDHDIPESFTLLRRCSKG